MQFCVCVCLQIITHNNSAMFTFYSKCYKHFTHSHGVHKAIWKLANYMITEYSDLLGHDAVLFGVWFPKLQINAVTSPLRGKRSKTNIKHGTDEEIQRYNVAG